MKSLLRTLILALLVFAGYSAFSASTGSNATPGPRPEPTLPTPCAAGGNCVN